MSMAVLPLPRLGPVRHARPQARLLLWRAPSTPCQQLQHNNQLRPDDKNLHASELNFSASHIRLDPTPPPGIQHRRRQD